MERIAVLWKRNAIVRFIFFVSICIAALTLANLNPQLFQILLIVFIAIPTILGTILMAFHPPLSRLRSLNALFDRVVPVITTLGKITVFIGTLYISWIIQRHLEYIEAESAKNTQLADQILQEEFKSIVGLVADCMLAITYIYFLVLFIDLLRIGRNGRFKSIQHLLSKIDKPLDQFISSLPLPYPSEIKGFLLNTIRILFRISLSQKRWMFLSFICAPLFAWAAIDSWLVSLGISLYL